MLAKTSFQGGGQEEPYRNLPVGGNQQLTIDQEIIGSILKEPMVEVIDTLLVIISSSLVALSTLNSIDLKTLASIIRVENAIAFVLAAEFFFGGTHNSAGRESFNI
jgi:hypothetical protein